MKCGLFEKIENKKFTKYDYIVLSVLLLLFIVYNIILGLYSNSNLSNNTYNITLIIVGFILGQLLVIYISTIFIKIHNNNIGINLLILIISLTLFILYYNSLVNKSIDWMKYYYSMLPYIGLIIFFTEYSLSNIIYYKNRSNLMSGSSWSTEESS
jgi:hypothetical protein